MKNNKGMVLPVTLAFMVFFTILGLGTVHFAGVQGETAVQQLSSAQAFWMAEAGAARAKEDLKNQIQVTLLSAIKATAPGAVTSDCNSYVSSRTPLSLLSKYGGFTLGTSAILASVPPPPFVLGTGRQGTYNATISVVPDPAQATNPTKTSNGTMTSYVFYYNYSILSQGKVINSGMTRKVSLGTGSFTVTVEKENFARYGLFTGSQDLSGDPVWFIWKTHYTGPIHTNDRFNFAGSPNPAGIFDGLVTQVQQTARFYNDGSYRLLNCDKNPCDSSGLVTAGAWRNSTTYATGDYVTYNSVIYRSLQNNRNRQPDTQAAYWRAQFQSWNNAINYGANDYVVYDSLTYRSIQSNTNRRPDTQTAYWADAYTDEPKFNQGFLRGQAVVNLPTDGTASLLKTEALGGILEPGSNGVYVPNGSGLVLGGIYVRGDACITLGISGNNPVYTIRRGGSPNSSSPCQGGTATTVTVNYSANTTTVAGSTTNTYNGIPDGMTLSSGTLIYVRGQVTGFSGTVQRGTNLTISAEHDVWISGHVQYQDDPRTHPDAQNLLGIISWGLSPTTDTGIRVSNYAPNDLVIQGVLMAPQGMGLYVDSYNSGAVRGTIHLLGGVIADSYGAVGQFNSQSGAMTHGYGRDFVYDTRMLNGMEPAYFPYTGKYITTNSSLDAAIPWREI